MSRVRSVDLKKDVSIVLCGQAGQGVQTVEFLLTRIFAEAGFHVYATKEYMSRVRGGSNSTEIRVSSEPVDALVNRIDLLAALNNGAIKHVIERISSETIILAEKDIIDEAGKDINAVFIDVAFTEIATEIGNKIYSNTVAAGAVAGLLGVELSCVKKYIRKYFGGKSDDIVDNNEKAAQLGYEKGREIIESGKVQLSLGKPVNIEGHLLLNGAEAIGLGAIAGGCNFISSYPMSPSTGVLVFLANHGREMGILVEQAEDEIAAINMAIGAWYVGARAMVTTSGGGFALMTEGLSLAGVLEMPVVIHLAQRPGPGTGLPTRTEQGDLEMALYAGHGEFPRIIFAPGMVEDAFLLTAKAFNLADKYQVPVFILTDQYLMDSYNDIETLPIDKTVVEKCFVKTKRDYQRYKLTGDGVSPRGIPGLGNGLVSVDSDEHDQQGHITEDLKLRVEMVDKRLRKKAGIEKESLEPELIGGKNYKNLVVCWGSSFCSVREALHLIGNKETALLYYKQVYPLHKSTADYLQKAAKTIIVEGNATGQFGRLIKIQTGIDFDYSVHKYNGLNFTVEEVVDKLGTIIG